MTGRKKWMAMALLVIASRGLVAQESMLSTANMQERSELIRELPADKKQEFAREYLRKLGEKDRIVGTNGRITEVRRLSPNGIPMYYRTHNKNAAATIGSGNLWEGGQAGLSLDGSGIVVGVWDGGVVRTSHREFDDRARVMDAGEDVSSHATHVAGTIAASGIDEKAHGMAASSVLESYDWNNDNSEMRSAAGTGLLISNHSYGFIHGWDYDYDKKRWQWYGEVNVSQTEDYLFGYYGEDAITWDEIANDHPGYLIVKSAGNDRREGPSAGTSHYVWTAGGWTQSSTPRQVDGGSDGYDCLGSQGTSKNILTVGAVEDISGGYEAPSDVIVASFSAFGPTDDGRIKPDIVANGTSLYSSSSSSDEGYSTSSGTSMSSPSVAGSLALLQEHHMEVYGKSMLASQLKALVIHTANEAGSLGPDYQYGWGLMNTDEAAGLISSLPPERFVYDLLEQDEEKEMEFFCSGKEPVCITIVWNDPAGDLPPAQLDPTNKNLVNDLDIKLLRAVDETEFLPWILDPANPSGNASRGVNGRDNVEQIYIEQPLAGYYTLKLGHKLSLSGGEQAYALVVTGLDKSYVASGHNELTDANGSILLTSSESYPDNMDVSWHIVPAGGNELLIDFAFLETDVSDSLVVFDGPDSSSAVLAIFRGNPDVSDSVLSSSTGEFYLRFSSDGQGSGRGFLANYCSLAPEGPFTLTGDPYPCLNDTSSYFVLGQSGTSYTWETDQGWEVIPKSDNGIKLRIGSGPGILTVTPYNRCGTATNTGLLINPLEEPPILNSLMGDSLPCFGKSSILYTDNIPGTTYDWEVPIHWTGSSNSDTLYFIPEAMAGPVSVSGRNACGKGNELSRTIQVVLAPGNQNILTDKVPPCATSLQDFYVDPSPGYSYLWEVQDDWGILGEATGDTVSVNVGSQSSFLFLTAYNECGLSISNRLFLTSELPSEPQVSRRDDPGELPLLEITNAHEYESLRWYRDDSPIPGEAGKGNPLIVNMNGLYTAESVSEDGCRNRMEEDRGIRVDQDQYAFLGYRESESHIVLMNSTTLNVNFKLVHISGRVVLRGELEPGTSRKAFRDTGIYLLHVSGSGVDEYYKVMF